MNVDRTQILEARLTQAEASAEKALMELAQARAEFKDETNGSWPGAQSMLPEATGEKA